MDEPAAAAWRLTDTEKLSLIRAAANSVIAATTGRPFLVNAALGDLARRKVFGVYLCLTRGGEPRGRCGSFGLPMPLGETLAAAASRLVWEDPRFPPVYPDELPYLDLTVWLLGPPEPLKESAEARFSALGAGRYGLRIQSGERASILLPDAPEAGGWDAEEFLGQVCLRAKLPPTAWREPATQLFRFEGTSVVGPLLPDGMEPPESHPPLTDEQFAAYLKTYAQTMAAMAGGMSPASHFGHLPDVNVSGAALVVRSPEGNLNWAASHLEVHGFVPLQSTMSQLCQQAAAMLRARGHGGRLSVDIAVLDAPAMHGTVADLDPRGFSPRERALLVAEHNRAAWLFDPQLLTGDLLAEVARRAGVTDPTAARVYSLRVKATVHPVGVASVIKPVRGSEERMSSAARRYYPMDPAERDAALKRMLGGPVERRDYSAVLVPHSEWQHSGRVAAKVLKRVNFPGLVIALGPKHTPQGVEWAVAPQRTWLFPGGSVGSDLKVARRLSLAVEGLHLDASAHRQEHGVEVLLPMIAALAPKTRVVGVAVEGGTLERCEAFAEGLAEVIRGLDEPPLLLISTDMNHFASDEQTRRLDGLALAELESMYPEGLFAVTREEHISMCGVVPAVIALKALRKLGRLNRAERIAYATTADATGDRSRVVGYAGMAFS